MNYKQQAIAELAGEIIAQGFRAFIAKDGDYGFYTDAEGTRIVSFSIDLGIIKFSGNYKTSAPQQTGTGWAINYDHNAPIDFKCMFDQYAPRWATGPATWRFTTLAEHLKTYQPSSQYTEIVKKSTATA